MCLFKKICNFFGKKEKCAEKKGKNILVVEDEPGQRLTIQKILEKQGYDLLLAENGSQGLAQARSRKPDLILLDVVMPEIDGREVCRQLKADESTKDIPIIFLTASDTANDIIDHFDLGADMHLTKPIDAKELIAQIEITFGN
ncbi:MAG: response regulator [Candidatus Omnitrophica bacterium]|nr:response regulator [Candidatus Omnitrophota bacterium]